MGAEEPALWNMDYGLWIMDYGVWATVPVLNMDLQGCGMAFRVVHAFREPTDGWPWSLSILPVWVFVTFLLQERCRTTQVHTVQRKHPVVETNVVCVMNTETFRLLNRENIPLQSRTESCTGSSLT
jgi:hypothetical protein